MHKDILPGVNGKHRKVEGKLNITGTFSPRKRKSCATNRRFHPLVTIMLTLKRQKIFLKNFWASYPHKMMPDDAEWG